MVEEYGNIINLKLNGKLSVSPSKVTVADWEEGGSYSVNLNNIGYDG